MPHSYNEIRWRACNLCEYYYGESEETCRGSEFCKVGENQIFSVFWFSLQKRNPLHCYGLQMASEERQKASL